MNFMEFLELLILFAFLELFLSLFEFSFVDSLLVEGRIFKELEELCLIGVGSGGFKRVRMIFKLINDISLLDLIFPLKFLELDLIFEFKDVIRLVLR
jgi:hypothetical protein